MYSNIEIKNLDYGQIKDLNIRCTDCNFWYTYKKASLLDNFQDMGNLFRFLKSKIYENKHKSNKIKGILNFYRFGGKIKAAFDRGECIGVLIYGDYYLFPKLKNFNVYPPDKNSTFISCIYVKQKYRNKSVGTSLLLSLEKDLVKEKNRAMEIIGQKNEGNYYEGIDGLTPAKFLIKKGFYIKKNDHYFPLLRLDLKNIIKGFDLEEFLSKNVVLQKEARSIW